MSRSLKPEYGKVAISNDYNIDRLDRNEYVKLWQDECIPGVLYALHKYSGSKHKLTMNEISRIVGWRRGSIKNSLYSLRNINILKYAIKSIKLDIQTSDKCKQLFWLDCEPFSKISFSELVYIMDASHNFKDKNEPNFCEQCILEILDEEYPHQFKFTGAQLERNKIECYDKNRYPDFTHNDYKLVLEHFGSPWHSMENEEEFVKEQYKKVGVICHIIWDYEPKDRNKIKNKLKEFVDNAISHIQ